MDAQNKDAIAIFAGLNEEMYISKMLKIR